MYKDCLSKHYLKITTEYYIHFSFIIRHILTFREFLYKIVIFMEYTVNYIFLLTNAFCITVTFLFLH